MTPDEPMIAAVDAAASAYRAGHSRHPDTGDGNLAARGTDSVRALIEFLAKPTCYPTMAGWDAAITAGTFNPTPDTLALLGSVVRLLALVSHDVRGLPPLDVQPVPPGSVIVIRDEFANDEQFEAVADAVRAAAGHNQFVVLAGDAEVLDPAAGAALAERLAGPGGD